MPARRLKIPCLWSIPVIQTRNWIASMATLLSRFGGPGILANFGLLRARLSLGTTIDKSRTLMQPADVGRLRELESLRAAIDKSQAVIEMDMDGTILTANESYLKMLGYKLAEITGKLYTLFVDPVERNGQQYQALWDYMRAGQFEQGRFKRVGKNAREIW